MALDSFMKLADAIGESFSNVATYTAHAAAQANSVSAQAQSAQGAFNQESANLSNSITDNRLASQYGFNAAQAAMANDYNTAAWERAAAWNEEMWQKQADFNAEQAEIQREWQEKMSNTQYQRAIKDMSKAGLNPILAVTNGGVGTNVPGGSAASVGGSSMSSAQAQMASGGVLGADSANVSNYSGQMEYMSGFLGTLSAIFSGISSAQSAMGDLYQYGVEDLSGEMADGIIDLFMGKDSAQGKQTKEFQNALLSNIKYAYKKGGIGEVVKFAKDYYNDYWSMSASQLRKKYNN